MKKGVPLGTPFFIYRAIDGTRTRDPDLGKVVLHQLSHCRASYQTPLYSIFVNSDLAALR